jgi:hypothetical protein
MKKLGEFCGCQIYLDDEELAPDEARMVSLAWDRFSQRIAVHDEVRIVGLGRRPPRNPPR